MSDNYSTGTVTDVIPMLCIWTESRNWISILVVRIILNIVPDSRSAFF